MPETVAYHRATWTAIGSGLHCPAAVARPESSIIDLFARGATGELMHRQGDANGWRDWRSLGSPVGRVDGSSASVGVDWQVAGCCGSADRLDLFGRSPDGDLLHMPRAGDTSSAFDVLGSPAAITRNTAVPKGLAGPPAVCSRGSGYIDVFAPGSDGDVLHTSYDGAGWSGFESLGMPSLWRGDVEQPTPPAGLLAACAAGSDRMGVFVRGIRGDLVLNWWDGTRWSGFTSLGMPHIEETTLILDAPLTGPPAACSWGPARIDVFARGATGQMLHRYWNGRDWSAYESLGTPQEPGEDRHQDIPFTGAVAACTQEPDCLDVFARGLNGTLYHARWNGTWDHG